MSSPPSPSSVSVPDSAHDSPGSSNTDSPLASFDRPPDCNDLLSFFLDSAVGDRTESTGDSSAEDSISSATPPSSHDSPTADWGSSEPGPIKELSDVWQQPDLSLFSLDGFNNSSSVDFSLGFDPMLFPNDSLSSMHPTDAGGIGPSADFSPFNFGAEYTANSTASNAALKSDLTSPTPGSSFPTIAVQTQGAPGSSASLNQLPALGQAPSPNDQLMDELARRARQLVGLTMALRFDENVQSAPDGRLSQHHHSQTQQSAPSGFDFSTTSAPARTSSSSPGSTPPTTTRTKTSHTTIERRYRTNLNARIQSLRAAVPALRVLEVKQGNRVGNLALKAGTRRVGVDPDAHPGQEDVIDERGYIDGVKVARKGSKANVLGKAVEYIHVLKRREMRLKREQEGLKALIRSLVGGPELVQQWEKMWRERFGGPEKDEVDPDEAEADDENDDGEDYDDVEEKESDETSAAGGKKRKRAKLDPLASAKSRETQVAQFESLNYPQAIQPVPIMPSLPNSNPLPSTMSMQPEKRKRGRPRKIPIPSVAMPTIAVPDTLEGPFGSNFFQQQRPAVTNKEIKMEVDSTAMAQGELQTMPPSGQQSGHQYLLAAFAFFSFFNSPISYSSGHKWDTSRSATHSGSVLGDTSAEVLMTDRNASGIAFNWRDVVQVMHLVVTIFLLLSIIVPRFPRLAKHIPHAMVPVLGVSYSLDDTSDSRSSKTSSEEKYANEEERMDALIRMHLLSALTKSRSLSAAEEAQILREALGLGTGILGLTLSLLRQMKLSSKSHSRYALERRMLEQKAFLRLAGLVALDANASVATRMQTYLYAFRFLSIFSASAKDLTTLALVVQPFWRSKSSSLWALARSRARGEGATNPHICKAYEVYVLESMTVDEAADKLAGAMNGSAPNHLDDIEDDDEREFSCPLAVLAKRTIRGCIRSHAESIFVQGVNGDPCEGDGNTDGQDLLEEDVCRIVIAGRSLDSQTSQLVDAFERVCSPACAKFASDTRVDYEFGSSNNSADLDPVDEEIFALLHAIILYRRVFPSALFNGKGYVNADVDGRMLGPGRSISSTSAPIPSPPPSPSRRDAELHLALRHCLDSSAFDRKDVLEDARDRVVDMLTAESNSWPRRLKYA